MQAESKAILLIDDEQGFHDLFRYLIEPLHIEVHSAYDGPEGLERIARLEYPVTFLDIHMPKMSGIDVLAKIREIKPLQKVVLLSSNSDPSRILETKAGEMGVIACLEKPFDAERALGIIEEVFGVSRKRSEPSRTARLDPPAGWRP